jgi:hypothetical protein
MEHAPSVALGLSLQSLPLIPLIPLTRHHPITLPQPMARRLQRRGWHSRSDGSWIRSGVELRVEKELQRRLRRRAFQPEGPAGGTGSGRIRHRLSLSYILDLPVGGERASPHNGPAGLHFSWRAGAFRELPPLCREGASDRACPGIPTMTVSETTGPTGSVRRTCLRRCARSTAGSQPSIFLLRLHTRLETAAETSSSRRARR